MPEPLAVHEFRLNVSIWDAKYLVGKVKGCNFALPNGTTPGGADLRKLIVGKKTGDKNSKDFLGRNK